MKPALSGFLSFHLIRAASGNSRVSSLATAAPSAAVAPSTAPATAAERSLGLASAASVPMRGGQPSAWRLRGEATASSRRPGVMRTRMRMQMRFVRAGARRRLPHSHSGPGLFGDWRAQVEDRGKELLAPAACCKASFGACSMEYFSVCGRSID